jgi:hypothetical protein
MSTLFYSALALSGSTLLTILSLVGLASWSRQIVKVVPSKPARLTLRNGIAPRREPGGGDLHNVNGQPSDVSQEVGHDKEGVSLAEWVGRNVGSLKGTFRPSWWLPK